MRKFFHTAVFLSVLVAILSGADSKKIRVRMPPRPGARAKATTLPIHQVPVNPPSVSAQEAGLKGAELKDRELVLGLVVDGQPMAYPVRYLAIYELVDDRVGDTALAPTW